MITKGLKTLSLVTSKRYAARYPGSLVLADGLQAESFKSFNNWLLAYRALARIHLPAWGRVKQGRWDEGSPRAIEHTQGI